ncbi:hypothetical protein ACFU6I_47530 [Streptomyces sp. NPDC057486]|uniref:hypothetical protein n=1 Tax=Streptomyces sp. NPDC057486 TaxID=3346145 RepID=UPI0036A0B6FC
MASARAVAVLPQEPGRWRKPKFDGHRTVLVRTEDTVTLCARSGRVVTTHWMGLATAGMELLPGTKAAGRTATACQSAQESSTAAASVSTSWSLQPSAVTPIKMLGTSRSANEHKRRLTLLREQR